MVAIVKKNSLIVLGAFGLALFFTGCADASMLEKSNNSQSQLILSQQSAVGFLNSIGIQNNMDNGWILNAPPAENEKMAFMENVYLKNGQQYIDVSYVDFFPDANVEKLAEILRTTAQGCLVLGTSCLERVNGGYYYNSSTKATLALSKNIKIDVFGNQDGEYKSMNLKQFPNYLKEFRTDGTFYKLTIHDGIVEKITEKSR